MVKASALYIVIIIALVIGVLCSALIVEAYFYKMQYQKKFRYEALQNNLSSGINILLNTGDTSYLYEKTFSLFNGTADSVSLKKIPWGLYDIGIVEAFIQRDTIYKTFSFANTVDSAKWAALYIIDEDRLLSLSGKTTIRGDAYIPKTGVKAAYVDNRAYQGDKRLIIGHTHFSEKKLPDLFSGRLDQLNSMYAEPHENDSALFKKDTIRQSFLLSTRFINFKKQVQTIKNINLNGNIVLLSDTAIIIDSSAVLNNILIFAKSISVKTGFHGTCQLFATDSIAVDHNCRFNYPSCLGVLRFSKVNATATQAKIVIGANCNIEGTIFTYEKTETALKPMIDLAKYVKIKGQVYSQGILKLKDSVEVDGSIFSSRFLYQSSLTLFENYLINIRIDSKALSPYYLTGDLLPVASKNKKILQWLEAN